MKQWRKSLKGSVLLPYKYFSYEDIHLTHLTEQMRNKRVNGIHDILYLAVTTDRNAITARLYKYINII